MLKHIANEHKATGNKYRDMGYLRHLKAMGMIAGAADYDIRYEGGRTASIEFKRDATCKLTENQVRYRSRCVALGIPYLCTYDLDEALAFMRELLC